MKATKTDAHAIVIHGAGDVRVEEREVAPPAGHEAHVHVSLGGICGSDISYFKHGAVGQFTVTAPMVLGHEVIGTVGELGSQQIGLEAGQRVAVDPSSPCGTCGRCLEGRSNICLTPTFLGSASTQPHTDGGFASVLLSRSKNLVPLDDSLADNMAVFAEPLAVTVHAIARAGGVKGARVLIVGAGPIGSMLAALCVHDGAAQVDVADISTERLDIVRSLGAHRMLVVGEEELGTGYDLVFDASGAAPAISDALTRARRGGKLILVGLPHGGPLPIPINLNVTGEVDIIGSFRFNHDEFRRSIHALSTGLDLSPLISNQHSSTCAHDAFIEAASGQAMKVQLDFTSSNSQDQQ